MFNSFETILLVFCSQFLSLFVNLTQNVVILMSGTPRLLLCQAANLLCQHTGGKAKLTVGSCYNLEGD